MVLSPQRNKKKKIVFNIRLTVTISSSVATFDAKAEYAMEANW